MLLPHRRGGNGGRPTRSLSSQLQAGGGGSVVLHCCRTANHLTRFSLRRATRTTPSLTTHHVSQAPRLFPSCVLSSSSSYTTDFTADTAMTSTARKVRQLALFGATGSKKPTCAFHSIHDLTCLDGGRAPIMTSQMSELSTCNDW